MCDIVPGKDAWRIKVRVARMWQVPSFLKPDQANTVEMVLIDEKGGKIQATIRKQLLYLFQQKVVEGGVYKMSFFSVAPSSGFFRPTLHPYRLYFQMKTKVQMIKSTMIPLYGLTFTKFAEVCEQTADSDYLVDVIGVMTAISAEREYVKDGKVCKMVILELTDDSGKCECALFGDYVDALQKMVGKSAGGMPIVVLQYVKIKTFREKASLQNVMHTTRLLVNPDIQEAIDFKNSIAVHGIDSSAPVPVLCPRERPSLEDEFLKMYPKKTLAELKVMAEDGLFIVSAIVEGMVEGEEWWYPACKCHKSLVRDSGAYYCKDCITHVYHMVPRFRVKLHVNDGTDDAVFVLFDNDMRHLLDIQCSVLVAAAKGENAGFYPSEMDGLSGARVLFKVEKCTPSTIMFDESYRVKRVCTDPAIVKAYALEGVYNTPAKAISQTSAPVPNNLGECSAIPSNSVAGNEQGDSLAAGVASVGSSTAKGSVFVDVRKIVPEGAVSGVVSLGDDVDFVPETQVSVEPPPDVETSYVPDQVNDVVDLTVSPNGPSAVINLDDDGCVQGDASGVLGAADVDEFVDGLIVSPISVLDPKPRFSDVVDSVKRSLNDAFDGVVDAGPAKEMKSAKIEKE